MQDRLNLDALVAELDEEFLEETPEEDEASLEEQDDEEVTADIDAEDEEEQTPEDDDEEEDSEEEVVNDDEETHKRNQAFQAMREERDRLAKTETQLAEIAAEYGLTKEQLLERWLNEVATRQAKKSGVTAAQFKQQQEMQKRIQEIEVEKEKEVFNLKTQTFVEKYNLSETQVSKIFDEARKMGLQITKNPELLEFVYKAVNYDNAIEEGKQKQLEISKKRTKTSTGKTGAKGNKVVTNLEDEWDTEIEALLKSQNIQK